jgi:nitrogen regulatory protein P-II 1
MNQAQANDRGGRQTDATTNSLKCLIAFLRMSAKDRVVQRLRDIGVTRFGVSTVKTYGEYKNFFASDLLGEQLRIDTVLSASRADEIARAIVDAASTGAPGDGIVIVLPAESVYLVRTGERSTTDDFHG